MSKFYKHLTLDERRKIYFWRDEKLSVDEIARRLGRQPYAPRLLPQLPAPKAAAHRCAKYPSADLMVQELDL